LVQRPGRLGRVTFAGLSSVLARKSSFLFSSLRSDLCVLPLSLCRLVRSRGVALASSLRDCGNACSVWRVLFA